MTLKYKTALVLILLSLNVAATELPDYVGSYSDIECNHKQGDILGTEITVLKGFSGESYNYYAVVQFAEGVAKKPEIVEIKISKTGLIKFNVNYLGYFITSFSGSVKGKNLVGNFSKPLDVKVSLPKRVSYWNRADNQCD